MVNIFFVNYLENVFFLPTLYAERSTLKHFVRTRLRPARSPNGR